MTAPRFYHLLLLTTLLVMAAPAPVRAEDITTYGPFLIQRFTEADGLVSSEVNGLYKDKLGFLWVSTFNGLSRYDGQRFENFNRQSGLGESNVEIIGEDDGGNLFIHTAANIYQYTGNRVLPFIKFLPADGFISTACAAGRGQVWAAYEGRTGLTLLSATGPAAHLPTATPVLRILKNSSGNVYVLESSGAVWLLQQNRLLPVHNIKPQRPYTNEGVWMKTDAAGNLWVYGANNRYLRRLQGTALTDSIAVPANTSWWAWAVGAAGGVYLASVQNKVYHLQAGAWAEILSPAQIKGSVYDMVEEANGVLWVPMAAGLLKVTRKKYRETAANGPQAYYTTDSRGQYLLCADSLLYTLPGAVAALQKLQPKTITNVYVSRKKEVWYCTEDAVYHLAPGQPLQQLNTSATYEGTQSMFRFRRVLEDDGGGIWISSYHGIFYKKGSSLAYYFTREGLTEGAIYTIALDKAGVFYAAGIRVYAFVNGRFQNVSAPLGLPSEISRLATDAHRNVWVSQGTNKIVRINKAANGRFALTDSLTLSLNGRPVSANAICFDAANNLWVCDNQSLYGYRRRAGGFTASEPAVWEERLSGGPVLYADSTGGVQLTSLPLSENFVRTYKGIALLQDFRPAAPQIHLTAVQLFKADYNWQAAGFATNALGIPQKLTLSPAQNFIRFQFSAISPDYSTIYYRYHLAGYDKDWSPVVPLGEAEYTGLPAGPYTLEVQARCRGGQWSQPLLYTFRVAVQWYLTWWAKCLWVALGVGLVAGLVYLRWQVLKRRAQVRQLIVEEQLKALRAQINPHFLQNTFAFLAHEFYTAHNTDAVKAIDRLSIYLCDVLRFSDKAIITLEEELEFAEEYLQMQQQLLRLPFTYTISIGEDVDVFDIRVPSMLLQPIIENALKYGLDATAENTIAISVQMEPHYIRCLISDTGNRTPATGHRLPGTGSGKGIALTTDRLKLYYNNKKHPPRFLRQANASGGCDVTLLIPTD